MLSLHFIATFIYITSILLVLLKKSWGKSFFSVMSLLRKLFWYLSFSISQSHISWLKVFTQKICAEKKKIEQSTQRIENWDTKWSHHFSDSGVISSFLFYFQDVSRWFLCEFWKMFWEVWWAGRRRKKIANERNKKHFWQWIIFRKVRTIGTLGLNMIYPLQVNTLERLRLHRNWFVWESSRFCRYVSNVTDTWELSLKSHDKSSGLNF